VGAERFLKSATSIIYFIIGIMALLAAAAVRVGASTKPRDE
jgi:hypothetical protein